MIRRVVGRTACQSSPLAARSASARSRSTRTIFRYTDNKLSPAIQSPYIKPQFPMCYDLSSDPHEDNNLSYTDFTNGWMFAPDIKLIYEYKRNAKEYPNIKLGEDFKGYKK